MIPSTSNEIILISSYIYLTSTIVALNVLLFHCIP